jgi:hypothetical protein
MSVYDEVVSAMLTGSAVKLPLYIKDSSLRSCYRRTQQQAKKFGQILDKKLKITAVEATDTEKGYKVAELVVEESIPFTIITADIIEQEKSDEASTE